MPERAFPNISTAAAWWSSSTRDLPDCRHCGAFGAVRPAPDRCVPHMVGVGGADPLRHERQRRMGADMPRGDRIRRAPFSGQSRIVPGQRTENRTAERAAQSLPSVAAADRFFPLVAATVAVPPHHALGVPHHILGRVPAVAGRVPLRSELGLQLGHRLGLRCGLRAAAVRTASGQEPHLRDTGIMPVRATKLVRFPAANDHHQPGVVVIGPRRGQLEITGDALDRPPHLLEEPADLRRRGRAQNVLRRRAAQQIEHDTVEPHPRLRACGGGPLLPEHARHVAIPAALLPTM